MASIRGIDNLTQEQVELMERVNKVHTSCVGNDYKAGMKIIEAWIDEDNVLCVRLENGSWFHYYKDVTWG